MPGRTGRGPDGGCERVRELKSGSVRRCVRFHSPTLPLSHSPTHQLSHFRAPAWRAAGRAAHRWPFRCRSPGESSPAARSFPRVGGGRAVRGCRSCRCRPTPQERRVGPERACAPRLVLSWWVRLRAGPRSSRRKRRRNLANAFAGIRASIRSRSAEARNFG